MDQLEDFADDRLINGCIYCGGPEETGDHVPSRVLLDEPLPENLPIVAACRDCNNGFSSDEEYLACLIESVVAGTTDPAHIRRPRVAEILKRAPALRARLEAAKTTEDGQTKFHVEPDRVRNVLLKLARGHAAYELSQPCRHEPASLEWWPLSLMTEEERDSFQSVQVLETFGEIGSRQTQRLMVTQIALESENGGRTTLGLIINDWVEVQEGRYCYQAIDEGGSVRVKITIGDYLACEVVWTDN
ncbi:MAG: hypothetical protein WD823_02530 [Sulfuricaulis sp.]|uniref:hypothetical protein n=1 Tax=Sulfuricaulis sp. TaxID=2003553 RepID=UPI0034A2FCF5